MPRIRPLSQTVVAQIAAGEVIERPAAVVKELLENSIDAGATRIDVDLAVGGMESIIVVDDGCGMVAEDLALAFTPHATSKLTTSDDLFHISTMGFRGEALASVGGVAQVLLQSRPMGETHGAELRCDGGTLGELRPWGGAVGTRIEVKHLFYNIPVRKKFLKSTATELGHVCEAVTRIALSHPQLHLVLRHNGRMVYEIPATAGLPDRIGLFFGKEIRDALFPIASPAGPIRLTGLIADPKCDRGNAKLQYFFVNGRWFRDRSLGHAFQEAYRNLLMVGRYAIGFLFLEVPPETVDVNVHPTKAEVRFRENSVLYSLIRSTVKTRLSGEQLLPSLQVPAIPIREHARPQAPKYPSYPSVPLEPIRVQAPEAFLGPRRPLAESTSAPWELPTRAAATRVEPISSESQAVEPMPVPIGLMLPATLAPGAVLQVHDAYLILETADGMQVIDQHALHERILFEQMRRRIREGKLEVQRLLIPEPIDLPAEQAVAVLEAKDALAELGLEVEDFGGNTILLSSYPTLLGRKAPHEILHSVIDELTAKDRPPAKEVLLDHLLAGMACKAAVKAGDRLTPEEIHYLLELRALAEESHHCPHGRPTSLMFSRQELDRQFRR